MSSQKPQTIDAYIAQAAQEVRPVLEELRGLIHEIAPDATEKISYGMPTFFLHGNLVHFAAFPHHIGLYATPSAHEFFTKELAGYVSGKGSVRFPLGQPLPLELIRAMVRFRVEEQRKKS